MSHGIAPGAIPPVPGLEKEEPELTYEDDIPSDDGGPAEAQEPAPQERPLRNVERE